MRSPRAFRKFLSNSRNHRGPLRYSVVVTLYIRGSGMDGLSGASAVVGLVSSVARTIQLVNELIQDIRKAPEEMLGLGQQLQLVKNSLTSVEDLVRQSHSNSDRNGSIDRITDTVKYCVTISTQSRCSSTKPKELALHRIEYGR